MNKKFHLSIEASTGKGVAEIKLVDRISEYGETSANAIRTIVQSFISQGVKEANLYINSRGGSVFEAAEIANELSNQFEKVNITVGAIAASAATRIIVGFEGVKAFSNSQFMIHRPKMSTYGDLNQIDSDMKMLKNTTQDYLSAYAKKFNKTEDEIEAMWANGDYWMNAKEALALGLIAEIIPEKQKLKAEDVAVLEACGCPNLPTDYKPETKIKMDIDKMRSALGLDATATEEQVLQAARDAKAKASHAAELEAESAKNAQVRAETLVDQAIADKKIGAEKRDNLIALATVDFDNTKEMLDGMQSVPKLSGEIQTGGEGEKNRDNWDLDAWLENDPVGLDKLSETDPEKFKKLNNL